MAGVGDGGKMRPEMSAPLEDLLERGEVECALILKGPYTERELEITRLAWEAGLKMGKQLEAAVDSKAGS